MDLQNLQNYLSVEQLRLCIMDERDEGIRLFILNHKELILVVCVKLCVFNCEMVHLKFIQGC